jgi:hypothetical protein
VGVTGGPSVDQGAVNQEQQNQNTANAQAAAAQQKALAGIQSWNAANPAPVNTANPLQMPGASSPATMGGGNIQAGGAGRPTPPPMAQKPPAPAVPGSAPGGPVAPPGGGVALNPAQRAHIMALIGGQGGAMRAPGM